MHTAFTINFFPMLPLRPTVGSVGGKWYKQNDKQTNNDKSTPQRFYSALQLL